MQMITDKLVQLNVTEYIILLFLKNLLDKTHWNAIRFSFDQREKDTYRALISV